MEFLVNELLEWVREEINVTERIIDINPDENYLLTIRVFEDGTLINKTNFEKYDLSDLRHEYEIGHVYKLEQDPFAYLYTGDQSLKSIERRDSRWQIIQPIVEQNINIFISHKCGSLITERSNQTGIPRKTIYQWIRQYFQGGQVKNALITNYSKCGGRGKRKKAGEVKRGRPNRLGSNFGINIDETVRLHLKWGAELYRKGVVKTKKEAYQRMLERFYRAGYEVSEQGIRIPILKHWQDCPSIKQFYDYILSEYEVSYLEKSRAGERKTALQFRSHKKNSTLMAVDAGSIYQFDATSVDMALTSRLNPEKVFTRPTLYIGVDVSTHLIVSALMTVLNPSWMTFALAFEQAVCDKVTYFRDIGIYLEDNEWPAKGIPKAILVDRGTEFTSENSKVLTETFGVEIMHAAPYRADMKGIVEQLFNTMNNLTFHRLPGAIPKRHGRGDGDYRLDAALNIVELRELLIQAVRLYNHTHFISNYPTTLHMIENSIKPIPIELWLEKKSVLRYVHQDVIRLNLLPRDQGSVTADGIRFNGTLYTTNDPNIRSLIEHSAVTKRRSSIQVLHNPLLNANVIYVLNKKDQIIPCYQNDPANKALFQDADPFEIAAFRELVTNQKLEVEQKRRQGQAELNAHYDHTIEKSTARTKEAISQSQLSKTARFRGMRNAKAADREREVEEIYTPENEPQLETKKVDPDDNVFPEKNKSTGSYIPAPNYTDLIGNVMENEDETE